MNEEGLKRCLKCKNEKVVTNSHKKSKSKDYLYNQCKTCRKQ